MIQVQAELNIGENGKIAFGYLILNFERITVDEIEKEFVPALRNDWVITRIRVLDKPSEQPEKGGRE